MVCWSVTHIQMCRYFIHCYVAIFLHDGFNCCNALWCHHSVCLTGSRAVCYRTAAVHELPSAPVHLLWWQTCIDILNFHSSINFNGFHPFNIKKKDDRTLFFFGACCKSAAIFTLLLRRRFASLHRTANWRPLLKLWVSLLSTYRESSCVSNFYRIFKVFIRLSLLKVMKNKLPRAWEGWGEAWHFLLGKLQGIKIFWHIRCK